MELREYFLADGQRLALDAFSSFAQTAGRSGWPIHERFEMYDSFAFSPAESGDGHLRFEKNVYNSLKSYWQIFRPHNPSECWSAQKIYETICCEFAAFRWNGPVNLTTLTTEHMHTLLSGMRSMETIKPNRGFPIMAVSKFLHFFNPALFPIYDEAIIWNLVLAKRFNKDFRQFHVEHTLKYCLGDTAEWLSAYIAFANWLLSEAHPQFMRVFAEWLNLQPSCERVNRDVIGTKLYATAFEYTIIGAAVVEGGTKRD